MINGMPYFYLLSHLFNFGSSVLKTMFLRLKRLKTLQVFNLFLLWIYRGTKYDYPISGIIIPITICLELIVPYLGKLWYRKTLCVFL